MNLFLFALLCIYSNSVLSKNIPSYVHLCKGNDPEFSKCFNSTLYDMIPYMMKGIPEMNIAPIAPLAFARVKMDAGKGAAVKLEIELLNGILDGLQNIDVNKLEGNVDTVRFSVALQLPYIILRSDYKIKGKIMLFEIDSTGHGEINSTDLSLDVECYGSNYMEQGVEHIRLDKIEVNKLKISKMVLKLEDSVRENQAFIETVNIAINENIHSLIDELDVLIRETLGEIFIGFFNRVFELFPKDQLFPNN